MTSSICPDAAAAGAAMEHHRVAMLACRSVGFILGLSMMGQIDRSDGSSGQIELSTCNARA